MADNQTQSFSSHTRWFPPFHFFALPVTLFYGLYKIVQAVRDPTTATAIAAVYAMAIATGVLASRVMALAVQDRLIRLEETMRMQRLLPATMHSDIAKISREQFVALRFASDAELADLVRRTVVGELTSQKSIKQAIKNWRGDYLRA